MMGGAKWECGGGVGFGGVGQIDGSAEVGRSGQADIGLVGGENEEVAASCASWVVGLAAGE